MKNQPSVWRIFLTALLIALAVGIVGGSARIPKLISFV